MLFPFIKELATVQRNGGSLSASAFGKVANPIRMMELEHEEALQTIREITGNILFPKSYNKI